MLIVTGGKDCPINSKNHTLQLNVFSVKVHFHLQYDWVYLLYFFMNMCWNYFILFASWILAMLTIFDWFFQIFWKLTVRNMMNWWLL